MSEKVGEENKKYVSCWILMKDSLGDFPTNSLGESIRIWLLCLNLAPSIFSPPPESPSEKFHLCYIINEAGLAPEGCCRCKRFQDFNMVHASPIQGLRKHTLLKTWIKSNMSWTLKATKTETDIHSYSIVTTTVKPSNSNSMPR